MKNYHVVFRVFATMFKWFTLDITLRPAGDNLFKLSVDRKTNCSAPGIYVNFSFLKLINIWCSVFDERVWDDKTQSLVHAIRKKPAQLNNAQIKSCDGLLGDLMHGSPAFEQMFHRYDDLPDTVIQFKREFNELSNDMEKYLRTVITTKR